MKGLWRNDQGLVKVIWKYFNWEFCDAELSKYCEHISYKQSSKYYIF